MNTKKCFCFFIIVTMLCFLLTSPVLANTTEEATQAKKQFITNAVYLGVKGYGKLKVEEVKKEDFAGFRFLVNGEEKVFSIKPTWNFSIQNKLQHGKSYNLVTVGNRIEEAEMQQGSVIEYTPPVQGKPNLQTIKNLLAIAMEPVGTVLYVSGGGWSWQGGERNFEAYQIGLKNSWMKFFNSQDANYNYKFIPKTNNKVIDEANSFFPFGGWMEFYYAGLDCSGYLGWVLDNIMQSIDGKKHFTTSTKFAKTLSDQLMGSVTRNTATGFKPGAVVVIKGHVYMCLGVCADGSIVILHSTPSKSKKGEKGGGVQLSALNPHDTGEDCEAYRLVKHYMEHYFPEWSKRYNAVLKDYKQYTNFTKSDAAGIFNWSKDVLPDPDGYCTKNAGEILKDLFGE